MNYFTYKAITSGPRYSNMKEGRNNRIRIKEPVIEHTYPNELIIDINELKTLSHHTLGGGFWKHRNVSFIDENEYNNVLKDKLFYPTQSPNYEFTSYIGAVMIHSASGYDILTYVGTRKEYANKIMLLPIHMLKYGEYEEYMCMAGYLPKRNVKCFFKKEDIDEHFDKANAKAKANSEALKKASDHARSLAPVFSLKTPKFKITEVVKKTEYLRGAGVGDIIYAEIPVIKESDDRKFGALKGIGTLTNWVTLYVNDKPVNTISPKVFPQLFFYNIVVEEV